MRTTSLIALLLMTAVASVGAVPLAGDSAAAPAPPAGARGWENKQVRDGDLVNHELLKQPGKSLGQQWAEAMNKLGADGWELVTVVNPEAHGTKLYYFKRPK